MYKEIILTLVILVLIGAAIYCSVKETFINEYHNSYCPRENQVYIHPPTWWKPLRKYNKKDWIVNTPDKCIQKQLWNH